MKKKSAILMALAMAATLLSACGSSESSVTQSTVELTKKGEVVEYTIESFAASYYDAEELQTYIDSTVEDFLSANDGTVEVKKDEVEDGVAYVTISFDSAQTYAAFYDTDFFVGSIIEAQTAGYDFDADFVAAEEAEEDEDDVLGGSVQSYVPGSQVILEDDLKVLIIGANVSVIVPGTVKYVSGENTSITAKNTVSVNTESENAGELLYILYE